MEKPPVGALMMAVLILTKVAPLVFKRLGKLSAIVEKAIQGLATSLSKKEN